MYGLTELVTAFTRLTQARQNPSMVLESWVQNPAPTEDLLAFDSSWERESQFSPAMRPPAVTTLQAAFPRVIKQHLMDLMWLGEKKIQHWIGGG